MKLKPQVDLFSFIFWRKLKTLKRHFQINWPLTVMLTLDWLKLSFLSFKTSGKIWLANAVLLLFSRSVAISMVKVCMLRSLCYTTSYRGYLDTMVSISTVFGLTWILRKKIARRFLYLGFYQKKSFLATWNPDQATNIGHL